MPNHNGSAAAENERLVKARGKQLRILVGTMEIAGMIPVFADGFRRLGHQVTTAIRASHPFYPDIRYDVELERGGRLTRSARLLSLIASHDVYVFQWAAGGSLRWNSDLSLLKLLGKRIVYIFMGDDVRHPFSYQQEAAPFYSEDEAAFILPPDLCERLERVPIASLLRNLRVAESYSDLILSVPCNSGLAVRPYDHLFVPLDLSKYRSQVPGRDMPILLHAPSNTGAKGTDFLLPVLDRLKSEGVCFELRLLHKAPHEQVVCELMNADVVVDQLFLPLHGKLAVEAMASGCAVATSNREDYEPFPPNRPLWHVYPGNLYHQLKRLLTDKELRLRLAHEGRRYVETYHDHVKIARRIIHRLAVDGAEQYDHYPKFYAEHFQLPMGVVLADDLKRLTAQIVQRWGLPDGVDPRDMIKRGLMSAEGLKASKPIPRWESTLSSPRSATV